MRAGVETLRIMEADGLLENAAKVGAYLKDALQAGLAGVNQMAGTITSGFASHIDAGIGFDAITVALLGRSRPLGIVLAGLLFGGLSAGGLAMQSVAQTPLTLTLVLQALVVLFVAAPQLVATLVPFLKARKTRVSLTGVDA